MIDSSNTRLLIRRVIVAPCRKEMSRNTKVEYWAES